MNQLLYPERKESFGRLADVVADNHAAGRRSYGASLKPELKRRTQGAFNETALGFRSFGDFLRAAAEAQVIDLHKAPRGPDWIAVPHGIALIEPAVFDAAPRSSSRIRSDIWACVIDWRDGLKRVYHKAADRAFLFREVPTPGELPEQAAQRRLYEANPDEFIDVPRVSFETQISWMREFADGVDDTAAREVLVFALGRERPAREFTDALRSKPDLRRAWRDVRLGRVLDVIANWASANDLTIDPFERGDRTTTSRSSAVPPRASDVRAILRRAIDRMPESELMRISIPVEYLLGE